jgi:hypothetical protein
VSRRVSLPGASELFRPTHPDAVSDAGPMERSFPERAHGEPALAAVEDPPEPEVIESPGRPKGSGRVRHDEKITVYVSSDELLALERARLELRAQHGLAVDRGRIVREAISAILTDLETAGEQSELVRRLS